MVWEAGSTQTQVAEWESATSLGITSVAFRYYYYNGSTKLYLQSDQSTFNSSDYSFTGTQSGNEWSHSLGTVPTSALDRNLTWEATANVSDLVKISESHYVLTGLEPSVSDAFDIPEYGLNRFYNEKFNDAGASSIISLANTQVSGGLLSKTATGGTAVLRIQLPTNRADNATYAFRARAADGHRIGPGDGITIEWRRTGDTTWITGSFDKLIAGTAGDTSIEARLTFGASAPAIETFYVGIVE